MDTVVLYRDNAFRVEIDRNVFDYYTINCDKKSFHFPTFFQKALAMNLAIDEVLDSFDCEEDDHIMCFNNIFIIGNNDQMFSDDDDEDECFQKYDEAISEMRNILFNNDVSDDFYEIEQIINNKCGDDCFLCRFIDLSNFNIDGFFAYKGDTMIEILFFCIKDEGDIYD